MDIFHACVIRCPREQRQKNRHLIIACHFSRSAASSDQFGGGLMSKNAIASFIVLPWVIFAAPLHLEKGSHDDSMHLGRRSKGMRLTCPSHRIDVGQCWSVILIVNRIYKPNSFSSFLALRCDGSRCGLNSFGSLFSHSERRMGVARYEELHQLSHP